MTTVPFHDSESNLTPETTFIYVLIDSETNEVRYVGKANNPQDRLYKHMSDKRDTYKRRWINDLQRRGLTPLLRVIEEIPYAQWKERECYWIDYYRSHGCRLTNTMAGGSGGEFTSEVLAKISAANKGRKLPPMSEETRRKMSEARKGRKNSPEAIAKQSATMRGKKASPETRAKLSKSHKGQVPSFGKGATHTPEARAKMSDAKKGKKRGPMSEETKRKISESQKGKIISSETRMKLSTSHIGQVSFMKGRKHTHETREKMSRAKRKQKSFIHPPENE